MEQLLDYLKLSEKEKPGWLNTYTYLDSIGESEGWRLGHVCGMLNTLIQVCGHEVLIRLIAAKIDLKNLAHAAEKEYFDAETKV